MEPGHLAAWDVTDRLSAGPALAAGYLFRAAIKRFILVNREAGLVGRYLFAKPPRPWAAPPFLGRGPWACIPSPSQIERRLCRTRSRR